MNVVIAIDSFKGSMSSLEAGGAAERGIRRLYPWAAVKVLPVADGGEGTVDALVSGMDGVKKTVMVTGPLGDPVKAGYGIINDRIAVIEMAEAAGITLVGENEKNPLYTTTYGVGELIREAIHAGCREFIIGIGGSATNDGGVGMLTALGFGFYDEKGEPIPHGAIGLSKLSSIDTTHVMPELKKCNFRIACDVINPLCGEWGCSVIYGPQKGATPQMVADMDGWLKHYAELVKMVNPSADPDVFGAGAAGGLGFAFMAFLDGQLKRGIDLVLEVTNAERYIRDADFVLTGEGRLDSQTTMGKVAAGVAAIARRHRAYVIGLAGAVAEDAGECNRSGIHAFFPILRRPCSLEEAMDKETAKANMTDTVEQIFRLIQITNDEVM